VSAAAMQTASQRNGWRVERVGSESGFIIRLSMP
jgi:hypothetical protein